VKKKKVPAVRTGGLGPGRIRGVERKDPKDGRDGIPGGMNPTRPSVGCAIEFCPEFQCKIV